MKEEGRVDLHLHSTASDGTLTPAELVDLAAELGLRAIAITDHDTVAGVAEAQDEGARRGVEVLSGVELSSDYGGIDVHILGYLVDSRSGPLNAALEQLALARERRNEESVERMAQAGYPISMEELRGAFPDSAVLGKPHVAQLLVNKGVAASVSEVIRKLMNPENPFYVPKKRLPLEEAAALVREACGVPVLAHPLQYKFSPEELEELLDTAAAVGIQGMECRYSGYTDTQQAELSALAARRGLLETGGSDFHGSRKRFAMGSGTGNLWVPYAAVEALAARRRANRAAEA